MRRWSLQLMCALILSGVALGCSDDGADSSNGGDNGGTSNQETPANQNGDGPERPSGEVDEVWQGEALDVDAARATQARDSYEALDKDELQEGYSPQELYDVFNEFSLTHFGPANQPLIEAYTGEVLDFIPDGHWRHISMNSAALAFETTYPVRGHVEYGPAEEALNQSTEDSERYFYNQLHHLRDLEPDTTYYYRLVAKGDDGETIASDVRSFQTASGDDWVAVPGEMEGPPYVLEESETTYVVTEDIEASRTALIVDNGVTDVTVDLNGHTIVHGASEVDGADGTVADSASGLFARSSSISSLTVLNGHFVEGEDAIRGGHYNGGLNAVYLGGVADVELAGLTIDYHAAETQGLHLRYLDAPVRIHHNRFTDKGYDVDDRHGIGGGRALYLVGTDAEEGDAVDLHHNLIARTRQVGMSSAPVVRDNEVYVDSWSTNSFALQPESNAVMERNKVMMSGYNPYGFGWAEEDLLVEDNLVQMEGVATGERRYFEDWGEMDAMAAFRITNYGDGGQERSNLTYRDNVVVGRARGGGIMRGTMFYTDHTIDNTVFEGGFIDVTAEDDTLDTSSVVGQGVFGNRDQGHLPAYYRDGLYASNIANVRFGDAYGRGDRHNFERPTFVRRGDHPDYATFVFDKGFYSEHHEIVDPTFEDGAGYDNVWWRRTGATSHYSIAWTLEVEGEAGAELVIEDADGEEVHRSTLDDDGYASVPLKAVTIRPEGWENGGEINDSRSVEKIEHTPHQVSVDGVTEEVEMAEPTVWAF